MALPTYDKSKRRTSFQQLPKNAYVLKIMGAREEENKTGIGRHLTIIFDIAEGEYKGFFAEQFEKSTGEDRKWPSDGTYYLNIPEDGDAEWKFTNWNSFFADLEDSNNGFVFNGDAKQLKGKLIGGKFHIEQTESKGNIYDHTRLRWTCVADDVRKGKAGKLPNDKLITGAKKPASASESGPDDFINIPDDVTEEEIPF